MPAARSLPSLPVLAALLALLAVLWFATLDARRLVHPDEGRYAEIAREMVATGDWVTPRLNDLKYFEKPPLQYWVTAAAFEAFGVREWAARLWPALAGFLAIVAIVYAGTALGGTTLGAFAALALAGTVWHAGMAQIVTLDSGLAFFLALTDSQFKRTWLSVEEPVGRVKRRFAAATGCSARLEALSGGHRRPVGRARAGAQSRARARPASHTGERRRL